MNCVDCCNLCIVNGEMLPEEPRVKLRHKSSDAFTWLVCGKDLARFEHTKRQVFSQVLRERRCREFALFAAPCIMRPAWHKAAILMSLLIAVGLLTATVLTILL
jgi:hypothetical protein